MYIVAGTHFDNMLRSIITNKEFSRNIGQLILGDKLALILGVRISGIGNTVEIKTPCPACRSTDQTYNLAKLKFSFLEIDPIEPNTNKFSYKLPVRGDEITFKFLTGDDMNKYGKYIKQLKIRRK